jgi:hypothetical protein
MIKPKAPFTFKDVRESEMSESEFEKAMIGLIQKGLAEKIIINGEDHYMITDMGLEVGSHLDSDPSSWN